ncbi:MULTISPECIES: DegT/DnrJ/EryC1/StrS aminotransferase family protein [unclassified Streptomyces]|uniref:DegT/DnrJ/EryC1/StrS family aminotransferase n=1 Tax=unclassified Streptomyces TaxID=2593676 RepID=UPI001F036139|nr:MULTISPECIES: aminotransferase class I/II-fold pyridoxal phosphate-dependent enzyme [unclassified Streptomyces]MCH0567186.1 aminotransferase class I/II-fold pyridoxal phosphate-dependent enzyme [Streptomyces sp. MUM 2J]MCH0572687.1 aminotransferase class I/II-fold pyridoxal phosphate-dependent enzyme [Streptomyces sp. MUM 136J]
MTTRTVPPRALAIEGGTPIRTAPWPTYDKGDWFLGEAEEEAAVRVIRSRRLFRYDTRPHAETEVGRFEELFRRLCGSAGTLAVSSGTAALALSLMAAGIGAGSRVACPVFTFAATPSAILLAGAEPVLVPVDEDLHIDLDALSRTMRHVDAVMAVHMRGAAEDMDAIVALADQAGVPVFEDAVPAMGVQLRGRHLGTFGLAGAFSTQSDKSINTGEGGILVSDDLDLLARATVLSGAYEGRVRRHFATAELDDLALPLYSLRMDELRGALATTQLGSLPLRLENLAANYAKVSAELEGIKGIRVRRPIEGAILGDALLLVIESGAAAAEWFARALRGEGIDARAFGDPTDRNVRAFWNWRFLAEAADDPDDPLVSSVHHVARTVDIPLSASMGDQDRADLVSAVNLVAHHLRSTRSPS